jgi:hypothetical protein
MSDLINLGKNKPTAIGATEATYFLYESFKVVPLMVFATNLAATPPAIVNKAEVRPPAIFTAPILLERLRVTLFLVVFFLRAIFIFFIINKGEKDQSNFLSSLFCIFNSFKYFFI